MYGYELSIDNNCVFYEERGGGWCGPRGCSAADSAAVRPARGARFAGCRAVAMLRASQSRRKARPP